jgi:predicted RNA binding protein YcfA (HicA-like mRNA interferase family)
MKSGSTHAQTGILQCHHPGDMPEGTLQAILKQAGIDVDDFLRA